MREIGVKKRSENCNTKQYLKFSIFLPHEVSLIKTKVTTQPFNCEMLNVQKHNKRHVTEART